MQTFSTVWENTTVDNNRTQEALRCQAIYEIETLMELFILEIESVLSDYRMRYGFENLRKWLSTRKPFVLNADLAYDLHSPLMMHWNIRPWMKGPPFFHYDRKTSILRQWTVLFTERSRTERTYLQQKQHTKGLFFKPGGPSLGHNPGIRGLGGCRRLVKTTCTWHPLRVKPTDAHKS